MHKEQLEIDDNVISELENVISQTCPSYGEVSYWDERYKSEIGSFFEWLQPWEVFLPHVKDRLKNSRGQALVIGCGNSKMSFELLKNVGRVTNIDISSVVIADMKERYSGESKLDWQKMSCTDLEFRNSSFDYVFDKGTIDTLFCREDGRKVVESTIKEIGRVLRPGGLFVLISHGMPATRSKYLEKEMTVVETVAVKKPESNTNHYIYICRKGESTKGM